MSSATNPAEPKIVGLSGNAKKAVVQLAENISGSNISIFHLLTSRIEI
jgi:hypothetical protein